MSWFGDRLIAGPLPRFWAPGGRWLNGKRRLVRRALIRTRVRPIAVDDETIRCTVLGRYRMYVDAHDLSLSPHLIRDGIWEMWVTEAIAALARPGAVAVDVGANLGYFTLVMAQLCGAAGHVHAFEPNPRVAARLRRTLAENDVAGRVTVHPDPLGARSGELLHLVVPERHEGGGHMVVEQAVLGRPSVPLLTRRLDEVSGARDATLVKIDAEGSEPAIWRGMDAMIRGTRLETVLMEFAPGRMAHPAAFLEEIGVTGFSLGYVHESRGMLAASADEILNDRSVGDRMLLLRR